MAIVAFFLFIGHSGSIPFKQPWWLFSWLIAVKAVILLEFLVALFLFNDHIDFIPVKKPWWLFSC
jgi:hypothetical protein